MMRSGAFTLWHRDQLVALQCYTDFSNWAPGQQRMLRKLRMDPAQEVVQEIEAMGGVAVADNTDITNFEACEALVQSTVARFGGLDVVVNNAGFLRDRMFVSSSEEEWDAVMNVHLKGHYCISRHAAGFWRAQAKAGATVNARIINTSSGAGLQGSIGQSNYAAAKAGIAALTLVQAAELGRYGVTANAIAPAARTRMTEVAFADAMAKPEQGFDTMDPSNISPLVVWLGSQSSSQITGRVFEVAGGSISLADGWRTGPAVDKGAKWSPEELDSVVDQLIKSTPEAQKVYGT